MCNCIVSLIDYVLLFASLSQSLHFVCHLAIILLYNAEHDKKKGGIGSIFPIFDIFDFEIPCGVLFRSGQSTPLQFLRFLLR